MSEKTLQPIDMPVNAVILEKEEDPRHWILGANSKIIYEVINPSGNWLGNSPTNERQKRLFETWGCTNFWGLSAFEIQLDYMIANNMLSSRALAFLHGINCANISYFDKNNKVNFSDKQSYIKTGTKVGVGNYVYKTPDLARNVGLIPESMLPFGDAKTEEEFSNPNQITKLMDQLGIEFTTIFTVEYEKIETVSMLKSEARILFKKHNKQAPLSLAIAICPGYMTDNPIARCNVSPIHVVGALNIEDILTSIYDSYPTFVKTLGADYLLPYVLKSIIYENKSNETNMKIIKTENSPHIFLLNDDGSKKIMILDMPTFEILKTPFDIVSQKELDAIPTAGTIVWIEREISS